ncbi:hypothetical protein F441_16124 [Phytophthora nicotianae CJ01A1]|uniref:Uncharacterized protein n=6 Tax=Phytophthora nicotianae TaxID=4792 RepID=W2PQZ4_PHYN3|nr:hypothetical protein PPTG_16332 [Phytophthora nicotianae INRA-310]XP_008911418.1 hypothetical protein PPTG_16335 [Phytophthora nicotianae INRA-310]ETI37842.1 hypothetical protein F443_16302 [Phytophthora nicotianae P1569]ETK78055.1 hypothetical protein L915_15848 [Phytophthora nicotianae]ETO66610.1 hypothetical protein F444_16295 [Phytophthora nicotianae P1976]ETP07737.1 hypothetical protein F441_16124 [Phytophthora nicotianae CJ01A1]ETP35753.1 hypothetical protein F442_16156 [Phytophthora
MATRARKRQRTHRQKPGSFWALDEEEDHLLHMDPSLMTERQQLAFLLRTTAHEASDASHSGDESSDDETVTSPRPTKKPKRIQRLKPPTGTTPTRRGPGRPPKHKKNLQVADMRLHVSSSSETNDKKLEAKVSPSGSDDIAHLDAARSFGQRTPRCALCCDYDTAYEASFSDALFLCPACDQKYPTQQTLGTRACMT